MSVVMINVVSVWKILFKTTADICNRITMTLLMIDLRRYKIEKNSITYLADLYMIEELQSLKYLVFAVLTKAPTDELREIHDRIPLILQESAIATTTNKSCVFSSY